MSPKIVRESYQNLVVKNHFSIFWRPNSRQTKTYRPTIMNKMDGPHWSLSIDLECYIKKS